jgi:hypothetical protein
LKSRVSSGSYGEDRNELFGELGRGIIFPTASLLVTVDFALATRIECVACSPYLLDETAVKTLTFPRGVILVAATLDAELITKPVSPISVQILCPSALVVILPSDTIDSFVDRERSSYQHHR